MRVREATVDDSAAIAEIQVNSYRSAYSDLLPDEYLSAFSTEEQTQDWKELLQEQRDLVLVAENADGLLVGYALTRKLDEDGQEPPPCELVALHVRREWHRQGAGRALVAAVAQRMHALGCPSLTLWVMEGNPAVQFYERLGGKLCGEKYFEIDDQKLRRKELGYCWEKIEDLF